MSFTAPSARVATRQATPFCYSYLLEEKCTTLGLSTKQYDAQKATAKKIKSDLDRVEQTAKRADEDAGYALDAKERYLQKEAELDAGIEAMGILVTQMASGDAEICDL